MKYNIRTTKIRFTIEARAYDIVGMAAHNFWVLRNERGHVLGQLHGLATNRKNEILPIGRIGDKLKFYHFGQRAELFGLNPALNLNYIRANQKSLSVFEGYANDVLKRWDNAARALPNLNSLEVPYTPFGIIGLAPVNSNTAYSLLGRLMGITPPAFPAYWQPGLGNIDKILNTSQLESMRYRQKISDIDLG